MSASIKVCPLMAYASITGGSTVSYATKYPVLVAASIRLVVTASFAGGSSGSTVFTVTGVKADLTSASVTFTVPYNSVIGAAIAPSASTEFISITSITSAGGGVPATSGGIRIEPQTQGIFSGQPYVSFNNRVVQIDHQIQLGNINFDTIAIRDIVALSAKLVTQAEWDIFQGYLTLNYPFVLIYDNGQSTVRVWDGLTVDATVGRARRLMQMSSISGNPYPTVNQHKLQLDVQLVET